MRSPTLKNKLDDFENDDRNAKTMVDAEIKKKSEKKDIKKKNEK